MPLHCASCASERIAGTFRDLPYCAECIDACVLARHRTPEEVVPKLEKLEVLGRARTQESLRSLRRAVDDTAATSAALSTFLSQLHATSERASQRAEDTCFTGDVILARHLGDAVDDFDLLAVKSLADIDLSGLLILPHTLLQGHTAALFEAAAGDQRVLNCLTDSMGAVLLGVPFEPGPLLKQPWLSRLRALPFYMIVLGLVRTVHLATILKHGLPPDEHFSEAERRFYLDLEDANVRRTSRAWEFAHGLCSEIPGRENRAEQLVAIWLLHPTREPIRQYLTLLYRCYVTGLYPETLIVCRSILERAVADAVRHLALSSSAASSVSGRIKALAAGGHLDQRQARAAHDVWHRGCKVVHETPAMAGGPDAALATIEATLTIVSHLERRRDKQA